MSVKHPEKSGSNSFPYCFWTWWPGHCQSSFEQGKCNLSITDKWGNPLLHSACKYGYHSTVEFLTAVWSEMSVKTSRTGRVKLLFILPLNIGHLEILSSTFQMNKTIPHCTQPKNIGTILNSLLLNQIWDASWTHRTKRRKLLFISASEYGYFEIVKFLVNQKECNLNNEHSKQTWEYSIAQSLQKWSAFCSSTPYCWSQMSVEHTE